MENLDLKLEEIKMLLPGLCRNNKLCRALLLSLKEFADQNRSRPYTYRKFAYLKELLLSLEKLSINSRSDEFCLMLEKLLMEMNFNHPFFAEYISNKLSAKAEEYETVQEKIEFWRGCQKEFAPFEIKPSLSLNPDAPSLKTSLTEIITSGLASLEKQTMQQRQQGSNEAMKGEKIETKLSVSQLAVFLRLAAEEGIIVHKNQSDIFRRVAATFQTAKTDTISVQSLRGKYHSPERAATDIVKDYLIGMMNRLRRL